MEGSGGVAGDFEGGAALFVDALEAGGDIGGGGFAQGPGGQVLAGDIKHPAHGFAQGRNATGDGGLAAEQLAADAADGRAGPAGQFAQGAQLHVEVAQGGDFAAGGGDAAVFGAEKFSGKSHPQRAQQGAQAFEGFAGVMHRLAVIGAAQFRPGQVNLLGGDAAEGRRQALADFDAVAHRGAMGLP